MSTSGLLKGGATAGFVAGTALLQWRWSWRAYLRRQKNNGPGATAGAALGASISAKAYRSPTLPKLIRTTFRSPMATVPSPSRST
jgi:hypothetical protein